MVAMRVLADCQKLRKLRDFLQVHPKYWVKIIITKDGRGKIVDIFIMILSMTIYFYFRKSTNKRVKRWLKRGYLDSFEEFRVNKFIYLPKWAWKEPVK